MKNTIAVLLLCAAPALAGYETSRRPTDCERAALEAYAERSGMNIGPNEASYDILGVELRETAPGRLRATITAAQTWDGDGPSDGPAFTGFIDLDRSRDGACAARPIARDDAHCTGHSEYQVVYACCPGLVTYEHRFPAMCYRPAPAFPQVQLPVEASPAPAASWDGNEYERDGRY